MTFWEHFLRLLPHKPVKALAALYWHMTRRKLRARNRLLAASVDLPFTYDLWIANCERNLELPRDLKTACEQWTWRPRFSVLLYAQQGACDEEKARSLASINRQIYPATTILNVSSDAICASLCAKDDDYAVLLRAGDELSEAALYRFAESLQTSRNAAVLYGDEDRLDRRGRRMRPWFKPQWNEELFLAQDYLSSAAAIETQLARELASKIAPKSVSELMLAATATAQAPIVHVPHILCHLSSESHVEPDRLIAVARHIRPLGGTCTRGSFGTTKVLWPLPDELPLVSIIVPTKDKLELLRPCVESVLEQTTYRNFEVLVVDNASIEARTAEYLTEIGKSPNVRVLVYPHRYNFSSINNFAAREARGRFLCLLNNDTEVIEPDWLTDMMRYAVRHDVGAVGAKLLYEDGSIQHAGVVVGIGEAAGHAHRFLPADEPGYYRHPHVAQFVTAVTAACLVIEKQKFELVGGLDEEGLEIAFNDVDLCLKLQAAGWRNVYVPHAVLLHHESKSRGSDMSPKHIERYRRELRLLQERWGTKNYQDPLHNPNLDRYSETFVLRM